MASVIGIVPGRVIREIRISNFLSDASFFFYFLFFSLFFLATAAATAAAAAVAVVVVVVVRRCWFWFIAQSILRVEPLDEGLPIFGVPMVALLRAFVTVGAPGSVEPSRHAHADPPTKRERIRRNTPQSYRVVPSFTGPNVSFVSIWMAQMLQW